MSKFWLKYGIYGCILGLMGLRIWKRAHEESKISLRPVFQPDCAGKLMDPAYSYQDITTLDGYGYARRPIYRNESDMAKAVADYSIAKENHIVCNGKSYPNAAALFQEMEQQAIRGGSGAKYNNITIITARK